MIINNSLNIKGNLQKKKKKKIWMFLVPKGLISVKN